MYVIAQMNPFVRDMHYSATRLLRRVKVAVKH